MFFVAVNGSSRKEGGTAFLLNHMMDRLKEKGAEGVLLHAAECVENGPSSFCTVCTNPCSGVCHRGNALGDAYELLAKADGIILGSPVYFGTVSAQLKAFVDRTRSVRMEKRLLNTVGVGVTSGATHYGGQETALRALHDMMMVQGMIVVGDGHEDYTCGHHGVGAQRPVEEDLVALKKAESAAERLWQVAFATQVLRNK